MKIVIPLLNLSMSGGMRITLQYAEGLARRGHQVTILVPKDSSKEFIKLPNNVSFCQVPSSTIFRRLQGYGYMAKIIALGRAIPECDVIVANSWQTVYPALVSGRRGVHVFHIIQHDDAVINSGRPFPVRWRNTLLYRYVYRLPVKKIAVSSWMQRLLKEKYGQASVCIPNGIDPTVFSGLPPEKWTPPADRFDILCLARSALWKGFNDVVAALRKLMAQDSKIRLIVATREEIDLPSDLPIVLQRPENDADLGRLFRTCSVFVFPSWLEGFGLPPLEAMACGAPVVMTDCGGVSDFARNGENCLVVLPRQPKNLAQAINRIRLDPMLAQRLAAMGLETSRKFTMDRAVEKMEQVMLEAI